MVLLYLINENKLKRIRIGNFLRVLYRQFYVGGHWLTYLVVRLVFVMLMFVRVCWWSLVNNSVESVVLVSSVVYGTNGTVWFDQRVLAYFEQKIEVKSGSNDKQRCVIITFDDITIASFMLGLNIAGMVIVDSIFECVFWWSLCTQIFIIY